MAMRNVRMTSTTCASGNAPITRSCASCFWLSRCPKEERSLPATVRKAKSNESKSADIMDVNASVIADFFRQIGASVMIHGHTHRPGRHIQPLKRANALVWSCRTGVSMATRPGVTGSKSVWITKSSGIPCWNFKPCQSYVAAT